MRTSIPRAPSRCPLLLLSSVLVLLLFGCATAPENGASSPTGETASPAAGSWRSQDAPGVFFVEMELGCYNLDNGMLYFAPAGSTVFQLLCSRPDCTHKDENCNAYAGEGFTYFDGSLYAVCDARDENGSPTFQAVKISPDGSGHQVTGLFETVTYPDGSTSGPSTLILCGKYAYYTILTNQPGKSGYESHIFRLDVTTGESRELPVSAESALCANASMSQFDGSKWYFTGGKFLEDGNTENKLVCVDMEAGTYTPLTEATGQRFFRYAAEDGTIFHYQPCKGFFEFDPETGEDLCMLSLTEEGAYEGSWAHYDSDYIYCTEVNTDGGRAVQIYDRSYALADQIEISSGLHYITATRDYVFFGSYSSEGMGGTPRAFLRKSDIGTGNLELISIDG